MAQEKQLNGTSAIAQMVEALQALQDETIEKAVTKAVATMLPKVQGALR